MIKNLPKKGSLIVAEPFTLNDGFFSRSVILLTEYNEHGCVGFIINKPSSFKISDLIPDISADYIVYKGGPVEVDNLYFIHNIPELLEGSTEIKKDIYWGGDFEKLKELIDTNKVTPNNIKFFLGYTGWDKDQLESEIEDFAWTICTKVTDNTIFSNELENLWQQKMIELGDSHVLFANSPEDPNLN